MKTLLFVKTALQAFAMVGILIAIAFTPVGLAVKLVQEVGWPWAVVIILFAIGVVLLVIDLCRKDAP